jgi:hypothetical protein
MKHATRWKTVISIGLLVVMAFTVSGGTTIASAQGEDPAVQRRLVRQLATILLEETHKATNLSRIDILKELREGKTLAEVITGHGATIAAVKNAAKTTATNRVNEAVKNGRLKQEQADQMLAGLDAALDQLINAKLPATQDNRGARLLRATGAGLLVRETAKQANIAQRDILKELREGKTLAQIATAHNADPAKIVSATVTTATTMINRLVDNKRLMKEQADALIAVLPAELNRLMNIQNPLGGRRGANPNATPQATPAS